MRPTPEDYARVDAIEAKLAELDPIFQKFCEQNGLRFNGRGEMRMWPRRSIWVREEVDRSIYLTMDLTVAEAMDRGFYPEMPWSLDAVASDSQERVRMLETYVFKGVPYSRLSEVLPEALQKGLAFLRKITREDVIEKGVIIGSQPTTEEDHARIESVAAKIAELDATIQRFCGREGLTLLPHGKSTMWRGVRLPEDERRCILLNVNTPFPDLMKRGFDSQMSCSLAIHASLAEEQDQPTRIYRKTILENVPYFQLVDGLESGLKEALKALRALTGEDIIANGEEM